MAEKSGIRFRKMQNATINAKLFIFFIFFLRKEVKHLFYAGFSTKYELCIPSED